jgi:hypothetical protein
MPGATENIGRVRAKSWGQSRGFKGGVRPVAGCLPEPLFARGVNAVAGTWIADGAGFADALGCGSPWGRFARKVVWRR